MNKTQAIAFFEQVKGQKIRRTEWDSEKFIIPEKLFFGTGREDHTITGPNNYGVYIIFQVRNGFERLSDDDVWGPWEFYDTRRKGVVVAGSCSCSSYDLLNFGHNKRCVFHREVLKLGSGR